MSAPWAAAITVAVGVFFFACMGFFAGLRPFLCRWTARRRAKAETRSYRSLSGRRRSASSVDGSGFWAERIGRPRRHPARKARREKARR